MNINRKTKGTGTPTVHNIGRIHITILGKLDKSKGFIIFKQVEKTIFSLRLGRIEQIIYFQHPPPQTSIDRNRFPKSDRQKTIVKKNTKKL